MISDQEFKAVARWCSTPAICARELKLEEFQVVGIANRIGEKFPWTRETASQKAKRIIRQVSEELDVLPEDITGHSRISFVVEARCRCIELLNEEGLNQTEIGKVLGGKNSSTISYALKKIHQKQQENTVSGFPSDAKNVSINKELTCGADA